MAIAVTIGGSAVTPLRGSLTIEQTYGARHVCTFSYADASGSGVHPALGDAVAVTDGATTVFGGLVSGILEEGLQPSAWTSLKRTVTATDYGALCDQRIVNTTWASGHTLKAVLTHIITDYLDDFSVTLDAGQATGATLEELSYVNRPLTEVLNDLADRTGWTWLISSTKVLGMYAAGTVVAPFSITTASTTIQQLSWESTRENYYNRLYVAYGTSGVVDDTIMDAWTATAGQTVFPLHYTQIGYRVVVLDGIYWPVGIYGVDAMNWTYDSATNSLQYAGAALAGGEAVSFSITVQFPQTTYAEIAAHSTNPWEAAISAPDCADYVSAQALATSLLAQYGADAKRVRFETTTSGLAVGQVITITLAGRHLSGTHLITSLSIAHDPNSATLLRYQAECVSGDYAQGTFLDTYRNWSGDSLGGGGGGTTSITAAVTPVYLGGSRFHAVQVP